MAVKVTSRSGKTVTLLDPAEKGAKYAKELKQGYKRTNAGQFKTDASGKGLKLDKAARAYRAGYLDAQKDSANAWKAGQAKRARGRDR